MTLLVGFYVDPNEERRREILACLERNAGNRKIDAIHVFVEDQVDPRALRSDHAELQSPKIRLIAHGRRVTFDALLSYANRELQGQRVAIANADIYFDHTLARLDDRVLSGALLCLSRWDRSGDGLWRLFDYDVSQDAWIFQSPIAHFPCDFHLGVPGCDNRLASEAASAGLVLSNPSRSIRAYHLHGSMIRRNPHGHRVDGPWRSVSPVTIDALPRCPVDAGRNGRGATASIAFSEAMGYVVRDLDIGVSSHTNESRPFTAIPAYLLGHRFTQVPSRIVSPVTIEFLSAGRCFVLVGTDWDGYYEATCWLGDLGEPALDADAETCHRPAFEIWSLAGGTGDRYEAPTQVMLVADHLEAR